MSARRVGQWISGVMVLAGVLTMMFVELFGIGLVITIIGLVGLGIFAILPPQDGAAPPS